MKTAWHSEEWGATSMKQFWELWLLSKSSPQLSKMATAPKADLYGELKRYALPNNFAKLWENKYMYEGRREIKL